MKILTFYSETHKEIYEEYFLKSFNKYLSHSFILKTKYIEQKSKDGSFESPGFKETMQEKIKHIIENIDINSEEYVVYADSDIQFFQDFSQDIIEKMKNYDILFQDDITSLCAGFMVFKQNKHIKKFFQNVLKKITLNPNGNNDQIVINHLINSNIFPIKAGKLDKNKYFTIASINNGKVWDNKNFNLKDKQPFVHHANYTIGVENKIKLLRIVKEKVNADY